MPPSTSWSSRRPAGKWDAPRHPLCLGAVGAPAHALTCADPVGSRASAGSTTTPSPPAPGGGYTESAVAFQWSGETGPLARLTELLGDYCPGRHSGRANSTLLLWHAPDPRALLIGSSSWALLFSRPLSWRASSSSHCADEFAYLQCNVQVGGGLAQVAWRLKCWILRLQDRQPSLPTFPRCQHGPETSRHRLDCSTRAPVVAAALHTARPPRHAMPLRSNARPTAHHTYAPPFPVMPPAKHAPCTCSLGKAPVSGTKASPSILETNASDAICIRTV
jgi:hypothetical protein